MRRVRLSAWALAAFLYAKSADALVMQISDISDFTVTGWNIGDPGISQQIGLCIYGLNVPALTSYAITVSSSPSGYRVQNGSRFIPYSLYWLAAPSGTGGTQLSDGVKLAGLLNLNVLSTNCALGVNAQLTFQIAQADMTAAIAGTYTGTITLLLSAN